MPSSSASALGTVAGLARPFTLMAPVLGTACGAGVVAAAGRLPYDPRLVGPALLSAAAATAASNAWNQAFDADLDRRNKPDRPIPSGRITVAGARRVGHVFAALALGLGALASMGFLACVAIGLLGTWIYSAPPLRTKRLLLPALLTIAVPRGVLVPVAGWSVLASPWASDPWALGLVAGLFVFGAAATKDFSDMAGDREGGCRTLPIVLGPARAARVIAPAFVVPFVLYPVLGLAGALHAPTVNLAVLGGVLSLLGVLTATALVRDPEALARGERNHPAWRGMYLLLLGTQVGSLLAYAL